MMRKEYFTIYGKIEKFLQMPLSDREIHYADKPVEMIDRGHSTWLLRRFTHAVHHQYGSIEWIEHHHAFGKKKIWPPIHRDDEFPAIIWDNGNEEWWWHGKLHRNNGPAIKWPNGRNDWFWYGDMLSFDDWFKMNDQISDEDKTLLKLEYGE